MYPFAQRRRCRRDLIAVTSLLATERTRYMNDVRGYAELMERRSMNERKESWEARILTEYEKLRRFSSIPPTCGDTPGQLTQRGSARTPPYTG